MGSKARIRPIGMPKEHSCRIIGEHRVWVCAKCGDAKLWKATTVPAYWTARYRRVGRLHAWEPICPKCTRARKKKDHEKANYTPA